MVNELRGYHTRDLKTLKLELLERIAILDDEARLLALQRLLDSPRGYSIPFRIAEEEY